MLDDAPEPEGRRAKPVRAETRSASTLRERNCSVARTVRILSDAWAFLIIREAFFGARRFETFRAALDMPRATLTERLKALTRDGVFRQVQAGDAATRFEYRLTRAGLDLYPSFIALMQFGDRWLAGAEGPPLRLIHAGCGCESRPYVACSACSEPVRVREVAYRDGPGAGKTPVDGSRRSRRASDPAQFDRGRPSSVSKALQIIGDRWSFLVIREAFFGRRRYDKLQTELNIAPNILTDRLARLVGSGVFERHKYQESPERFEYRLTEMGRDLYGPMIMMMAWGDRWLAGDEPPLLLTHRTCGRDFTPVVVCSACRQPIDSRSMRYRMCYDPTTYGEPPDEASTAPGRL
ncbi:winged helix-turn-helix transcriptional regulator [Methylobacterium sp. ID0610]|uniref:winged helix-turn-helix transcriptional regulator n=1 Tax=Methylobacterium carpenticola TaxID=3344827 RepID=UPI003686C059